MTKRDSSISSSSALSRTSVNPTCELVAAIALEEVGERDAYEQITQRPYEGEYGLRVSIIRRGQKFETNNHANDAAALRRRVAELFGYPSPNHVSVRNLEIEVPLNEGNRRLANLQRLRRTRDIIKTAYLKKGSTNRSPDLVIHPTLELPVLIGADGQKISRDSRLIIPDFMVLDRQLGVYLIGDEKSFIVRDETVVDSQKLDQVRRQIAVGTLAMRSELASITATAPRISDGLLIFASPYGLSASRMVREPLEGEIADVQKAIPQMQRVAKKLADLRAKGSHQLAQLADSLGTDLRESCYSRCIMADYCEIRTENTKKLLGRDAHRFFGDKSIAQLQAMLPNRGRLSAQDEALLNKIENAAHVLGFDLAAYLSEVA
jgi:hypothetical protein